MTKPDICMPVSIGDTLSQAMRLLARQLGGCLLLIMSAWKAGRASPQTQ
jgi:uncharacterized protein YdaU (DUF1376 family)